MLQWENEFTLGGRALSDDEIGLVKFWAVHTMRRAYSGLRVVGMLGVDGSPTCGVEVRKAACSQSWQPTSFGARDGREFSAGWRF